MDKMSGTVVRTHVRNSDVSFFVANDQDIIQKVHLRGRFYEEEELDIIAEFFPRGGVFCDIGANVGNHSIYVAKFLHAQKIIVLEPNPAAISILRINLALNDVLDCVDTSLLGVGLSDAPAMRSIRTPEMNLGGAWLTSADGSGDITLVPGDDILLGRRIDFLKIDVEGMDLLVLAGLKKLVGAQQPAIFIEIDDRNASAFRQWLETNDYRVAKTFRRYRSNENYMALPVEERLASKELLEAGKQRLAGDTALEAASDQVEELRAHARQLKEALAELTIALNQY